MNDHAKRESGKLWSNESVPGVELFRGDFLKYAFTRHFHSVTAFGAVESGAMRSWHRDSNHTLGFGTVMMFNPGDVHAPFPVNEERWSFRMFYLQDELFDTVCSQFSKGSLRFGTPFAYDPVLAQKIISLHWELEGHCGRMEFDCRLLEIFEHISQRHAEIDRIVATLPEHGSVVRMRDYIHAHAADPVTLDTIADVARLSPYHALRSFRDALGLPPHKYLLQVRVERAKALLQDGMPIAEVAAAVGFADQSHLTRKYKSVLGVTPAQSLRRIP